MREGVAPVLTGGGERSLRRRLAPLALTIVAHLLILLLLLKLAPAEFGLRERETQLVTVALPPPPQASPVEHTQHAARAGGGARAAKPAPHPAPLPKPAQSHSDAPLDMLHITQNEMASLDTAMLTKHAPAPGGTATGMNGEGTGRGSAEGEGTGPGSERLYNADWYREPSHAELAGYLRSTPPDHSAAEIKCRTVPNFHVEDCTELGETPPGSGLARAMREASWQFLVRPPRVGGHALVGSWVRILFTWDVREAR